MNALLAAALVIRLYNGAGVPAPELLAAGETVAAILTDAGLDVTLRHCGAGADACAEPLTSREVVVRVIDAPLFNTALHPDAFGVTYVVRETNRGWLATVFADRISGAAARVGLDASTLLGRVAAHEIGHLLLGTGYHGQAGVMQADWPDDRLTHTGGWRFSMREAARLHDALSF